MSFGIGAIISALLGGAILTAILHGMCSNSVWVEGEKGTVQTVEWKGQVYRLVPLEDKSNAD